MGTTLIKRPVPGAKEIYFIGCPKIHVVEPFYCQGHEPKITLIDCGEQQTSGYQPGVTYWNTPLTFSTSERFQRRNTELSSAEEAQRIVDELGVPYVVRLFRIDLRPESFDREEVRSLIERTAKHYGITEAEADYLVINDRIDNKLYESGGITIRFKNGIQSDFADASDQLSREILMRTVAKSFVCFPKELATPKPHSNSTPSAL